MEAFEGHKLANGKTLVESLRDAGFDISTLKFSISLVERPREEGVPSPKE